MQTRSILPCFLSKDDLDTAIRTIYGEARGEYPIYGITSLIAVSNVIGNRYFKGTFGATVTSVCQKPYQFSCWNRKDPNYAVLMELNPMDRFYKKLETIFLKVITKQWPDITDNANHYHSISMKPLPKWAHALQPTVDIGRHRFYKT